MEECWGIDDAGRPGLDPSLGLDPSKDGFLGDILVGGDCEENCVEYSDLQAMVRRDRMAVRRGRLGLKEDAASYPLDSQVPGA